MTDDAQPEPRRKPLVSVEFQTEIDVATGHAERRMFVKMYFDARDSGLLAALGDRRWRTLCVLATYMDENGNCFPSQALIAKHLGIHRQRVNERIQELLAFRFENEPVVTVRKLRVQTDHGGRWGNNMYRLRPVTGFGIFDTSKEGTREPHVRKPGHRPVSGKPDTGNPDTNQNQFLNKKVLTSLPNKDHQEKKRQIPAISERALRATYGIGEAQLAQVHYLVGKQGEVLGSINRDHGHFVKRAAEAVVGGHVELLDETLSRFRDVARKRSPSSYPAYFQTMWTEALEKRQIRAKRDRDHEDGGSVRRSGFEPLGDILRQSRGDGEANPSGEPSLA